MPNASKADKGTCSTCKYFDFDSRYNCGECFEGSPPFPVMSPGNTCKHYLKEGEYR